MDHFAVIFLLAVSINPFESKMSSSDDEDETICPLCVEEMDLSDKNFLPCPCGYRVIALCTIE